MSESKATVSESVLIELAGRMYECCDLQMAIEAGKFSSLAELLAHLKEQSSRLDRTIKAGMAGEPLMSKDCCVVLLDAAESDPNDDTNKVGSEPRVVQVNIGQDQRNSGADAAGVVQTNIGANQRNAGRHHCSDGDFYE